MPDRYFRGQGKVLVATLSSAGVPQGFRYLGNCPMLQLSTEEEKSEHKESYTGDQKVDLIIKKGTKAKIKLKLEDLNKENLAFAFRGATTTVTGTTVTDESIPYIAKGLHYPLANIDASGLTLAKAPSTALVEGTDYTADLKAGMFHLLSTSAVSFTAGTDNILADYTFGSTEKISAFTSSNRNYWLRFNGLNTVEDKKPVVIDVFKTNFTYQTMLDLISDELTGLELEADALYDDYQSADGGFFKIRQTVMA